MDSLQIDIGGGGGWWTAFTLVFLKNSVILHGSDLVSIKDDFSLVVDTVTFIAFCCDTNLLEVNNEYLRML